MATLTERKWIYKGQEKVAYRVSYEDSSGKRRHKQFSKRGKALEFKKRCEGSGPGPADRSITVAMAAQRWLDACEMGTGEHERVEASTLRNYDGHVRNHIVPMIGGRLIAEVRAKDVKKFRDDLIKRCNRPTAKKILQSFHALMEEARADELIPFNPVAGIKIKISSREKTEVEIPTQEEVRQILDQLHGKANQDSAFFAKLWRRYQAMIMTMVMTGLRPSELRGLPWCNVDLREATITIDQRADEKNLIGKPKSAAGYRTLQIPRELVGILRRWQVECPPGHLRLVFPNWQGNVEGLPNIHRRCWYPLQEKAGIVDGEGKGKYHLYALRHFRASILIDSGASAKEIMVEMGHSSIQMTYDTYGHLMKDNEAQRRERTEAIAKALTAK